MPEQIKQLIESIRPTLPNPDMTINSCLVSRYLSGGNGIPAHRDDSPTNNPEGDIITVSVGAERQITFRNNDQSEIRHQSLKDCSMLVMSRFTQDFWTHEIGTCESANVRYSFTLRHIDPHFINSTLLIRDSNTAHVKFGTGIGTLGAWMPGKRVKAGHIEAIPDASKLGPYRNFVIHTGINNLNGNGRFRKSNKALIDILEQKIVNISETYKRAKIHVSLLLPSRLDALNSRIRDFNNLLLDMTCKLNQVSIIEHSLFGDKLSDIHGRWTPDSEGSNTYIPRLDDTLHLGKVGIRLLAKSIKQNVVIKSKSRSEQRFNGGRGGYRRALVQGRTHQNDPES